MGRAFTVQSALVDEGPYRRCGNFALQARVADSWRTLAEGTGIGKRKRIRLEPTTARRFRLVIRQAEDVPTIAQIELFGKEPKGRKP